MGIGNSEERRKLISKQIMNFKIFIHLLLVNIITGSRSKHFLIETVTNQVEHGSDYAEDRKEEFTPTIHGNDDAEEKDEENNMMKVIHAFEKCKTGGSQKCECANGKKFIIPVFQDDVRKQLAALDENQAAVGGEEGTDY